MLGEEDRDPVAGGGTRRPYLRSVSWTDRSPSEPNQNLNPNPRPQPNSKARSCLPPLQPLSIARRNVEEWPKAGSDDLGIWPNPPQTPGGEARPLESSNSEQPVREFQFKRDKLAFFDKECSRIADHIYLGSDAVAKNREILRQNGITHVLNCVGFVSPEYFKSDLVYKTLWLQDSPSEDITSILYDVFDYFEDVREQGGRVLVHCCQGVSRSTSLVIAYLMWREGQSFEDAFQYVKAARGVTNPNMGFACQLLQCQKRVHAVPASPNSVIRMYRMAPHSSYDPLHLVPKMLNQSGVQGLDSRGAFIVHVPSAIYIWTGKNCNLALSNSAMAAAFQVVRYERAQGPIVSIKEGEEPSEFWDALANGQHLADDCENVKVKKEGNLSSRNDLDAAANEDEVGERKVDDYNLDFEIFHKALDGGVVPPFSVSNTRSETCLPARENGWGRLRRKFSNGIMKEFVTLSKPNSNSIPSNLVSNMIIDTQKEVEHPVCAIETSPPLSPSTNLCGSPDSFDCFPNTSPDRIRETSKVVEHSVSFNDPFLSTSPCGSPDSFSCSATPTDHCFSPTPTCGSPDSFSCFPPISPKFSSKSPTLSPSTSDHSSSFTFSPSSSNWSDLSYLSSQQPSPSGWEPTDPFARKNASFNSCLPYKETPLAAEQLSGNHTLRMENISLPYKGTSPSIAERRGSNPPPRMMLPSVDELPQVPKNLIRSWSFSLPDLEDDLMKDVDCNQSEHEGDREELMLDAGFELPCESENKKEDGNKISGDMIDKVEQVTTPVLLQWPSMNKVEVHPFCILNSRSVYILLAPDASLDSNSHVILYVWLGSGFLDEKRQSQMINTDGECDINHPYWETVGRNFLNQMCLPMDATVQIIREGKEPQEFLSHLSCLSFQKTEDSSHS
ncbi:protein-tyrosine-phosphatase MKP1-like isoform X1 [Juglans microcarpa x Juglans regia]|uniref:protein-tyrosine-phosphatase MKP1-like isoform X1 n=1 Tax=Juglans microcarpa x Juglans regia TaxID=2249226 RepID=UPI001B7EE85F|nr:protein-tyrosine-phosphatase MKP1-like isoform X1 [Juglans microcarpa x Juglans regia]